jgi:TolA-binding protein
VRLRRLGSAALGAALVCALAPEAWASSSDALSSANTTLVSVGRDVGGVQAAVSRARTERETPEQRLANGELLFRMKDYGRAIVVLSEILEEFPNTPSYPDALWLRGETYYAAKDYLAARRDYRGIVDRGTEPRFVAYLGKALARLVDV